MVRWTLRSAARVRPVRETLRNATVILLTFGVVSGVRGGEAEPGVGTRVLTHTSAAKLRVGSHDLGTLNAGTILTVEKVRGAWLWIRTGSRQGWILRSEVVPCSEAVAVFTAALGRDPRDVDALIGRGVARHAHGQADGAIADFKAAIGLDPNRDDVYNNRGVVLLEAGEVDRAIADFSEAMRRAPRGSIAPGNRAAALAQKGELDRALADYTAAIELHRDVAGLLADTQGGQERGSLVAVKHLRGRADVWRLKRKHDMALADYTEALLLDPADAASLLGRGIVFGEKRQFGQAVADLTEAIRLDPDDPRAYKNRGYFRSLQGDHESAIADFNEAIRLGPEDAQSYLWRGTIRALKTAARTVPSPDSSSDARGTALADFDAAIRLSPSDPTAYRCRAAALARLGDHKQALADYDAAIRLDPSDPWSASARAELLAVGRKL